MLTQEYIHKPTRVSVLVTLKLNKLYDYLVPEGESAPEGTFVTVSIGKRQVIGVVWKVNLQDNGKFKEIDRLKPIISIANLPPLPQPLRDLIDWVADYTLACRGSILKMVISGPKVLKNPRQIQGILIADPSFIPTKTSHRQVLDILSDGIPRKMTDVIQNTNVSRGVINGLIKNGILKKVPLENIDSSQSVVFSNKLVTLSEEQSMAAVSLVSKVKKNCYSATLLDGVTGSGKTEVYFEAIASALNLGQQVLVLLPEISLSSQWLKRFQQRFESTPNIWHSDLKQRYRHETWRAVATGNSRIVVGARSALWLPFKELGLIIVDEEHDGAFKQEDGVIYHARDIAVARARMEQCPIILSSATPSLETLQNVKTGRYKALSITGRHGGALLPRIEVVDMRKEEQKGKWISAPLHAALKQTLESNQQALLFLNRRGYAPLTLCKSCGHRISCPNCSTWLVAHHQSKSLNCHHCGYVGITPTICPNCEAQDKFVAWGPGVERIAEEATNLFPTARCKIITSDTISGPTEADEFISRIRNHKIDLIIGTQMIAKGYHFPLLTLVGVIDADLGLAGGDLRAAEHTYQLLHQVAGRAGRELLSGRVLLQTYMPEHPVMAALCSGERNNFLTQEMAARQQHSQPPVGRLAALIISGIDEHEVSNIAHKLVILAEKSISRCTGIQVLGPAPAPIYFLRNRYRYRLLVKSIKSVLPQPLIRSWLEQLNVPSRIDIKVDIDPYNFL